MDQGCTWGWGGGDGGGGGEGGGGRKAEGSSCVHNRISVGQQGPWYPACDMGGGEGPRGREQKAGGAGAYQIALCTCAQQMMAAVHMGCELQCMLSVHNQFQAHHGRQDV